MMNSGLGAGASGAPLRLTTPIQPILERLRQDQLMSSLPLSAISPDRRHRRRIEVMLPVEVEIAGENRVGRISELSRAGARITLRGEKASGDAVVIRRSGLELQAQIVWVDGLTAGLWFAEPMSESFFLQLRKRTFS